MKWWGKQNESEVDTNDEVMRMAALFYSPVDCTDASL